MDYADADLVCAVVKRTDHLKARALRRLAAGPLEIPFSVGIELLFVARKFGVSRIDFLAVAQQHFTLDRAQVLLEAAALLDEGEVGTVFDAVHVAQAHVDRMTILTTDRALLRPGFPTTSF